MPKRPIPEVLLKSDGLVSVLVVLLGFAIASILVVVTGRSPGGMYSALLQVVSGLDARRGVWNIRYVGEWLVISMPLILCGFSMAFASRTGLFNIGAEGQYVAGITAAQIVALYGPRIPVIHVLLAVTAAMAAGGLCGALVGYLKARYSVSEVVATIMMNYIVLYLHRWICLGLPGSTTYKTPDFPETARLSSSLMEAATNGSHLNYGIFLTIGAIFFFWIIMGRTRLGYSLRATGYNKEAARCAGINVNRSITTAMGIAGAFAGLAGVIVALGSLTYGRIMAGQDGYGFDGIAVALVGNNTAWGTAVAGLLFGMLKSAQPLMQTRQIPKEIVSIIIGLVVVFISLRGGVRMMVEWRMKDGTGKGETAE
ncbi:MAG: ABC transporter permease [Treponema sp.]|jgi:simple sugar transport system permease protein|nr:ABC transporter permease [Treponema sp.]